MPITVDVHGNANGGIIGYKAKNHAGLVDVDKVGFYEPRDFWDPVPAPGTSGLILDPADLSHSCLARITSCVPHRICRRNDRI